MSKFLRNKFPQIFELIHISEFHFRKVAIDTSLYVCNYKALYGEKGWLRALITLISSLRQNEVHCVFIYDSGYPEEKEGEKNERRKRRNKLQDRLNNLESAIELYKTTGEIDPVLVDFQAKRNISQPKMLVTNSTVINLPAIIHAVEKMRNQLFTVTQADFDLSKELLDILNVPYFDAPMEAETMCADLCKQGKVDAVLSEDTDILAYGSPVFLTKYNTKDGSCYRIRFDHLLRETGMNQKQFLDFCIMCGTDYNSNIPGIGPVGAFKLILKHGNIENVIEEVKKEKPQAEDILNYKRTRELFQDYQSLSVSVPFCGCPDFSSLQVFMFKKNIRVNMRKLKESFTCNNIIFEVDT